MSHAETIDTQAPRQTRQPVRVPLVTEPRGLLKSLNAARQNVLSIIP